MRKIRPSPSICADPTRAAGSDRVSSPNGRVIPEFERVSLPAHGTPQKGSILASAVSTIPGEIQREHRKTHSPGGADHPLRHRRIGNSARCVITTREDSPRRQLYRYYEVVYDEGERVILFREYKRGEVIRTEEYRYDEAGLLTMRILARPGKEDAVTLVEAVASEPLSGQRSEQGP